MEPYKTYYLENDISDYEIRFCDDSKHFAVREKHGLKESLFMLYSLESTKPVYSFDIYRFVSDWWITPKNEFVVMEEDYDVQSFILKSLNKNLLLPFIGAHGISSVETLCFNKDCSKVVRGTYQGHVTLFNGIDYIDFNGVTGHVEFVDIDENEEYVLALASTIDRKHVVIVWNVNTQKKIAEIPLEGYPKQARFTTGESLNIIITEGSNSYLLPFGRMRDLIEQFDMNNNN